MPERAREMMTRGHYGRPYGSFAEALLHSTSFIRLLNPPFRELQCSVAEAGKVARMGEFR